MMSSFFAIFRKEFLHIRRNKAVLFLAVMLPLMQLTLFGFIDQTVHDVPTVVVDQDRSVASRELMDQLRATKTFAIKIVTSDPRDARTEIIAGRAGVGIVIPPDYHDKRARGEAAKILVLIDGSDSIVSSGALAAVNGVIASQNLRADLTRFARAHADRRAADHPLQPRGAHRELHHPGPGRGHLADDRGDAGGRLDRARARAGHDGAAAGHARSSARA